MNILVLGSNPKVQGTKTLLQTGERRSHKMIAADPSFFSPLVSDITSGYDRLYDLLPKNTPRIQANQFDCIIPRISNNLIFNTFVLSHLTENLGVYSLQSATGLRVAQNKFHSIQIFSKYGLKTPLTVYAKSANNIKFLLDKVGGTKWIIKTNTGSQGAGVMLMETRKSAISTIQSLLKNKTDFILQEYIESKNQDIRAIVCGDRVICAMLRTGPKSDFRSNISLGGSGVPISLSADDQNICVRASKAVGLEFSGVDLLKDKHGTTYVSEINGNPGTKIMQVTGINIWDHLFDYIENREVSGKTAPAKSNDHYYTQLKNENHRIWGNLKFFKENRRMQEILQNSRGKDIQYTDISGRKMQRKINSIYDLYRVVFDTFLIK